MSTADATPDVAASFGQLWHTFPAGSQFHNPMGIVICLTTEALKLQIEAHRKAAKADRIRKQERR
jgi:hypothetical protein